MTAKTFTIKKCYAKDIYKGTKVFEIRPATKMWTSIAHNQVIKWHWYKDERLVTRLIHFLVTPQHGPLNIENRFSQSMEKGHQATCRIGNSGSPKGHQILLPTPRS